MNQNPDTGAVRGSGNVFADLGFPEAEAAALQARSRLMQSIQDRVTSPPPEWAGEDPAAVAAALGTDPGAASLDDLVRLASKVGLRVRLELERAA